MCDENTICIVPIEGVTWTGLNDDVEALDKALDEFNKKTGYDNPIHVDAASGGFILPFLDPHKKWDFRLKWVLSISTSGHKFGLVYPGLGWVVWKDKKYLPDEIIQCKLFRSEYHTSRAQFLTPGSSNIGTILPIYSIGISRIQSRPIQ